MPCSFCTSSLHNINRCNHQMIDILYENIKVIYIDTMYQYPQNTEARFKSKVHFRFNLKQLRAVGVRYINALVRTSKLVLVNMLWQYFNTNIYQYENEYLHAARRLPVVPDPIPEFAQDLEHQPDDENSIIWYIDRTPSQVNIPQNLHEVFPNISGRSIRNRYLINEEFNNIFRHFRGNINESNVYDSQVTSPTIPLNLDETFSRTIRKFNIIPSLLVQEGENLEECDDCPICYDSVKLLNSVKINCGHKFCGDCVIQTLKHSNRDNTFCAMCRGKIETCVVKKQEVYDKIVEYCNL